MALFRCPTVISMKLSVLCVALVLCGCGRSPNASTPQVANQEGSPAHLPLDHSTGFLDGYSLRVTREDDLLWNGRFVTDDTFNGYLGQLSAVPQGDSLFIAFEPGVSPALANRVRRQVIDSGLCAQDRCWEVDWDVKRPVVN